MQQSLLRAKRSKRKAAAASSSSTDDVIFDASVAHAGGLWSRGGRPRRLLACRPSMATDGGTEEERAVASLLARMQADTKMHVDGLPGFYPVAKVITQYMHQKDRFRSDREGREIVEEMVKEQVIEEEAEAVQFIGANYVAHYAFVVRLADKRGESELVAALQAIHGTHAARMGKPPPRAAPEPPPPSPPSPPPPLAPGASAAAKRPAERDDLREQYNQIERFQQEMMSNFQDEATQQGMYALMQRAATGQRLLAHKIRIWEKIHDLELPQPPAMPIAFPPVPGTPVRSFKQPRTSYQAIPEQQQWGSFYPQPYLTPPQQPQSYLTPEQEPLVDDTPIFNSVESGVITCTAPGQQLNYLIQIGWATVGVKRKGDDRWRVGEITIERGDLQGERVVVMAVIDGHRTALVSEYLEANILGHLKTALESVTFSERSQAEKEKELEDALEIEYRTIDHILFSDDKFINAGGSTLLVALCLQERLYVINLGDSLAFIDLKGSSRIVRTREHNVFNTEEMTRVAKAYPVKANRLNGNLQGTRSIGDPGEKGPVPTREPVLLTRPEVMSFPMDDVAGLCLASDGVVGQDQALAEEYEGQLDDAFGAASEGLVKQAAGGRGARWLERCRLHEQTVVARASTIMEDIRTNVGAYSHDAVARHVIHVAQQECGSADDVTVLVVTSQPSHDPATSDMGN